MGDPQTLTNFLAWGTQYAPAQHYELIVQGHGDRNGFGPDATSGGDDMLGKELRGALAASPFIDILALEACEMQAIEVASELIGEVGYAYGSPTVRFIKGNIATVGDPLAYYENGLNWLVAHPGATPRQLAQQVLAMDQLGGFVVPSDFPQFPGITLVSSVIDISQMATLNANIDAFAQLALTSATSLDWQALRQARVDYTTPYEFSTLRDVGDYFKAVYSVFASSIVLLSPSIRDAAQAVVDQLDNVMVGQKGLSDSRVGLSIYFPESPNAVVAGYSANKHTFLDTKNPHGTHWREFLLKLPVPPLQLQPIVATIVPGQAQTPTNAVPAGAAGQPAYFEGTIETPEQVNFFAFNGSAGQVLYSVAEGEHIGTLYPVLTIYGPDLQTILAQVEVTNPADVAKVSGLVLPETGTYYVVVSAGGNLDPLHPVAGNSTGRYFLSLTFGDPGQLAPRLEIEQASLDFGVVTPGELASTFLRLANTGGTTLTINELVLPPNSPFQAAPILLPFQLGPGEWIDWPFLVTPDVAGQWSSVLHILSDDPLAPDQTVVQTVQAAGDYGDAPAPYPTSLAANGARHVATGPLLGANRDSEADGQPDPTAAGDDSSGTPDDEDGVAWVAPLVARLPAKVVVTASAVGQLDAWIDFNRDGDWIDAGEQIAASLPLVAGPNNVTFAVPAGALAGTSFARFRLSTIGGLASTGDAADGEVEDYQVQIISPAMGSSLLVDDPTSPGQKVLVVTGTGGNDVLIVEPRPSNQLQVRVKNTGRLLGIFQSNFVNRIVAFGLAGNDTIVVDGRLTMPAELHGNEGNDCLSAAGGNDRLFGEDGNDKLYGGKGSDMLSGGSGQDSLSGGDGGDVLSGEGGNDKLYGEAGSDVLLGGAGNDQLLGGNGRDLLIGGAGRDSLFGQEDDDILIGGSTTYDAHQMALQEIVAEWGYGTSFLTRITKLQPLLHSGTVLDDGTRDDLDGGGGCDWLLDFALADTLIGFQSSPTKGDRKN
jgi:Ca2+-binding RTX toxin-like protein